MTILTPDKVDFKVLQCSWSLLRTNIRGLIRPAKRKIFFPDQESGITLDLGGVITF